MNSPLPTPSPPTPREHVHAQQLDDVEQPAFEAAPLEAGAVGAEASPGAGAGEGRAVGIDLVGVLFLAWPGLSLFCSVLFVPAFLIGDFFRFACFRPRRSENGEPLKFC